MRDPHAKEGAKLAGKMALTDHLPKKIAQQRRVETIRELFNEGGISGHGLRGDDMRALDARLVG